jgi:intein/homing endonuclease
MRKSLVGGAEFNGVVWEPIPQVVYCHDYGKVWRAIQKDPESERRLLRELVLSDLFFVVNFILRIPRANHLFVVDACRDVQEGPRSHTLDVWAREHFKAIDINEPVLTPTGWKPHGKLEAGDYVYSPSGSPVLVVGRSRVFHETCYRVSFSDGYSVIVNGDHLWYVGKKSRKRISGTKNKRQYRDFSVLKTSELYKHAHKQDERFSVPLANPIQNNEKKLLIPPYVLGVWLGDGTSSSGQIASDDIEIVERIRGLGFDVKKTSAPFMYTIYKLVRKLRQISVLNNKHIPESYMLGSELQRWELLRGLMDTDGTCDKRGTATFVNVNERLAQDVYALACSLGLSPRIRKVRTKFKGEPYAFFQVSFQSYKANPVFHLERKALRSRSGSRVMRGKYIVKVEKLPHIQPTSCIKVDSEDGLYLVGKQLTVTHNTTVISVAEGLQRTLADRELTTGIFSNARRPAESIMRSIKRVMEESEILKWCFPDVLWADPVKESPLWSDDKGLVVKRSGYQKESTFECWGLIDGMPTGPHFGHRIYDDVVTAAVVPPQGSPETMEKVKENFDLSENLGAEGGTCRVIGTFYHHEDPLVYIQNKRKPDGTPVFTVRKKPATVDGSFGGASVFLNEERLNILRTNRRTFACQQLLDPTPQEMMSLDPDMLTCVSNKELPQRLFKFMVVDFAGQGTKKKDDAWAIHVVGVNPWVTDIAGSDIYLLDTCIRPMSMDEAMRQIVLMYTRNGQIWEVGVEKVSATTMEVHVENALRSQGKRGAVVKVLQPKGRKKESRIIQALEWPLGNNKIKYYEGCDNDSVIRLKDEMKRFPYWHDDGIDALSYVYDLLVDFPFAKKRIQQSEEDLYKRADRWKDLNPKMRSETPWYYV